MVRHYELVRVPIASRASGYSRPRRNQGAVVRPIFPVDALKALDHVPLLVDRGEEHAEPDAGMPRRHEVAESSFLQRMERTGRRPGTRANCTFLATDDESSLRAAALIALFRSGYVEPAAPATWAPHVLAHQTIALAMQERGVPTHEWWNWLHGCAAFKDVSAAERERVVRHMVDMGILVDSDARLTLGPRGEKLYGARNFLELYAVFSTPRVLRVMHGRQEVGLVDAAFLQDRERQSPNFVLAGHPWPVVGVNWKGGSCSVEPAEAGGYPRWFGQPVTLPRVLCQAIRLILQHGQNDPCWSNRAVAAIDQQRASSCVLRRR